MFHFITASCAMDQRKIFLYGFRIPFLLEDNHQLIFNYLLYLDRCRIFLCCHINVFRISSRRNLDGYNTCMGIFGKVHSTERGEL